MKTHLSQEIKRTTGKRPQNSRQSYNWMVTDNDDNIDNNDNNGSSDGHFGYDLRIM